MSTYYDFDKIKEEIWSVYQDAVSKKLDLKPIYNEMAEKYNMPVKDIRKLARSLKMQNKTNVWTPEEDKILVNTILQFLGEGKTQTTAFEKAAEIMEGKHTSKACAFRWNGVLRKNYLKEIEEAKIKGEEFKRSNNGLQITLEEGDSDFQKIREQVRDARAERYLPEKATDEKLKESELEAPIEITLFKIQTGLLLDKIQELTLEVDMYKKLYEREKEKNSKIQMILKEEV